MAITQEKLKSIKPSTPAATPQFQVEKAALAKAFSDIEESDAVLSAKYDELLGSASSLAKDMMAGKIPKDVEYQIRQQTAERSLARGLGSDSQAARNLTARDLGLTSVDLATKGVTIGTEVARLFEAKRQFSRTYELNMRQFLDSTRRTDLAEIEVGEGSRQFNVNAELQRNKLLADVLAGYHSIGAELAMAPVDTSGAIESLAKDFGAMLERLRAL